MADKPLLSVRLLKNCILSAGCSASRTLSMASIESALAALVYTYGSAAVCELWSKPRLASHPWFDNTGSGAAWESDVAGAAVAKGDTARAWLGWGWTGSGLQQPRCNSSFLIGCKTSSMQAELHTSSTACSAMQSLEA